MLIVGGKRGSLDPVSKCSVVNSEYREAKKAGLDCLVFVDKQVFDLLSIYKKNPTSDFSPIVDNNEVFSFIDELVVDTKWIFQFQRNEEIIGTLKTQLSIRLRDLLHRVRENKITIPPEFIGEPASISDIVINKGQLWEYHLACEILKDRVSKIDRMFYELRTGVLFKKTKRLAVSETTSYIQTLFSDISAIATALPKTMEEINRGFGPPGAAGDAAQIKRGCDHAYNLGMALHEWELDIRHVRPHDIFQALFQTMHGWSEDLLVGLRYILEKIQLLLSDPNAHGKNDIVATITIAPKKLADFNKELDRLQSSREFMAALSGE